MIASSQLPPSLADAKMPALDSDAPDSNDKDHEHALQR